MHASPQQPAPLPGTVGEKVLLEHFPATINTGGDCTWHGFPNKPVRRMSLRPAASCPDRRPGRAGRSMAFHAKNGGLFVVPQSETCIAQSDAFEQQSICFFFRNHVTIGPKVYSDIRDVVSSGLRGDLFVYRLTRHIPTLFAKQED